MSWGVENEFEMKWSVLSLTKMSISIPIKFKILITFLNVFFLNNFWKRFFDHRNKNILIKQKKIVGH